MPNNDDILPGFLSGLASIIQKIEEHSRRQHNIDLTDVYSGLGLPFSAAQKTEEGLDKLFTEASSRHDRVMIPFLKKEGASIPTEKDFKEISDKTGKTIDVIKGYGVISHNGTTPEEDQKHFSELQNSIAGFFNDTGLSVTDPSAEVAVSTESSLFLYMAAVGSLEDLHDYNADKNTILAVSPLFEGNSMVINRSGMTPVHIETANDGYKLTADNLRQTIEKTGSDKIAAITMVDPPNPTFSVYSKEEKQALADVIAEYNIPVIVDELYSHMEANGKEHISLGSLTAKNSDGQEVKMSDTVLTINGSSKKFEMQDPTIGFATSTNKAWIKTINDEMGPPDLDARQSVVLSAVITEMTKNHLSEYAQNIQEKRDHFMQTITEANEQMGEDFIKPLTTPEATFFATVELDKDLMESHGVKTSSDLVSYLKEAKNISTRDVDEMGVQETAVRVNFMDKADITEMSERITSLHQEMKQGVAPKLNTREYGGIGR